MVQNNYKAIVIGGGHAGVEASLALARCGVDTLLLCLNLDSIAFMACNPSVGGTGKGHLVREIDALGGEMGVAADKAMLQMRMLNLGKGSAVQSLRFQADKNKYHTIIKQTLENTPNLTVLQSEAVEILAENGKVKGVVTSFGEIFYAEAVIAATGVYLNSEIIAGTRRKSAGPSGFAAANELTKSLINLGFSVRRFKTGTPCRVHKRSIDFSKMEVIDGEDVAFPFSALTKYEKRVQTPCYLAYTNQKTHQIIRDNIHLSPLFSGQIKGTGARYCPSIEDKVIRFSDKERHQIFIEPEGADTDEMYVQGLSTSLPHSVQKQIYQSISGMENVEIMRYAYAIEYDCIDTLDLYPTLEFKKVKGLYTAGQINGTSGYEEAAAQGLIAGINAALYLKNKPPLIIKRDEAYIGVLIDDLVTKGTNEPYRIMTSRAEYRLTLRQDNADFRLTEKGRAAGLVSDERYSLFKARKETLKSAEEEFKTKIPPKKARNIIDAHGGGGELNKSISYSDMIKRGISASEIKAEFNAFEGISDDVLFTAEINAKYEGYIKNEREQIEKMKKLEDKPLPADLDYMKIQGLRIEARQKLNKIKPANLGQASRISGVNPADISVLMIYLNR